MRTAPMYYAARNGRLVLPVKVLGYRLAMIVSSGFALVIADQWLGWNGMYMAMGLIMGLCAVATFIAPEPEVVVQPPRSLRSAVVEPLLEFFKRPEAITILLFNRVV